MKITTISRTNCEVSDDFEYISSRGRDFSSSSDIYCSLDSDLHTARPGHSSEDRRLGTARNKISSNRKGGKHLNLVVPIKKVLPAENEIEKFERKFLRPLTSSSSSTRIVIKDGASTCHQPQVPAKVQPKVPAKVQSKEQSKVQSKVQPPVMSAPHAASQVAGGSAQPQHVRVLRTESKVGTRQLQVNFITQHFICTSTVDSKLQIGQTWVGWVSEQILSLNSQHSVVLYFTCGCVEC